MTLMVMLSLATVVVAVGFATYVARVCRGAHDIARSLGASGAQIQQIARQTGLQQDVISAILARPSRNRQNIPRSAETARRGAERPRVGKKPAGGTDVAAA